jgi:hypothetical protein
VLSERPQSLTDFREQGLGGERQRVMYRQTHAIILAGLVGNVMRPGRMATRRTGALSANRARHDRISSRRFL